MTPWTIVCQALLFMGFPRQQYWSGLPCTPSGDLPDPGIKLESLVLACGFSAEPSGKPILGVPCSNNCCQILVDQAVLSMGALAFEGQFLPLGLYSSGISSSLLKLGSPSRCSNPPSHLLLRRAAAKLSKSVSAPLPHVSQRLSLPGSPEGCSWEMGVWVTQAVSSPTILGL